MVGGQADVKLVSNAMANATRSEIMAMLVEGNRKRGEIEKVSGPSMLDYHLQVLKQAGLVSVEDEIVSITDFGRNFMESKAKKHAEAKKVLAGAKPIQIAEIRQLLPCIADRTKFRTIAIVDPPLGEALKILAPLFPGALYSEKIGALIIQRGNILITANSTGNITMIMISSENEAKEILEELKRTINETITKGITPVPREKIKVDQAQIYEYLPKTDCKICGDQSCYDFAKRLMGRETTLDKCTPLLEPKNATSQGYLSVLLEYL